jgi:cellulose 1,4-beta-cellobiosidase
MGNRDFYGPGMTIDTTKKFTVVTQFIGSGSTLTDIKRFYVQGGTTYATPETTFSEIGGNSISDDWCEKQKTHFGDKNHYKTLGGLNKMAESLARGHVLVMSLWDDHSVNMLWLDSTYPTDKSADTPGVGRGTCATDSGKPDDVEANAPGSTVTYSNIKFGPIGSTFKAPA